MQCKIANAAVNNCNKFLLGNENQIFHAKITKQQLMLFFHVVFINQTIRIKKKQDRTQQVKKL